MFYRFFRTSDGKPSIEYLCKEYHDYPRWRCSDRGFIVLDGTNGHLWGENGSVIHGLQRSPSEFAGGHRIIKHLVVFGKWNGWRSNSLPIKFN